MLLLTDSGVYSLAGDGRTPAPSIRYEGGGVCRCAEAAGLDALGMEDGSVLVLAGGEVRKVAAGVDGEIASLAILSEDPLQLLIGAEPPYVYNLVGDGPAERNRSFADLPVRNEWYTPWGGPAAVRSLACTGDGWVYADIHVGSIMRSADGGRTWDPVTPQLHVDVHQVSACPADDDRVYAQTADAFWISYDRGQSWEHRAGDLGERYGRCVTVHPQDPDLVLATVSDGPHGDDVHGQLYRSEDAGLHWTHVTGGFPASTRDNIDTFHAVFSPEGAAWAVVDNGLYFGGPRAREWSLFWEAPEPIRMLSCRTL
jgi:photosystem II stability/assembly factor-like uncharacterized protein